jgi:hypothetical protein
MKVPRAGLSMLIFSKSNLSSSQSIANPNQVPNSEKYCPSGKLNSSSELQNSFFGVFFYIFLLKSILVVLIQKFIFRKIISQNRRQYSIVYM